MDDIRKPTTARPQPMTTTPPPRTRMTIPIGGVDVETVEPVASRQAPDIAPISSPTPPSAPEPVEAAAPIAPIPPQTVVEDPEESLQPDTTSTSVKLPVIEPQTDKAAEPEQTGKVTQAPANHAPRKGHWGAIIVSVILALALIVGAGYAYMQNQKTLETTNKVPAATKPEVAKDPATANDVLKSSQAIDSATSSISDTVDSTEADLSDTTLGL